MRVNRSATENCFKPRSSSLGKKKSIPLRHLFTQNILSIIHSYKLFAIENKGMVHFVWFWFLKFSQTSKFYNASILCSGSVMQRGTVEVQSNEQTLP